MFWPARITLRNEENLMYNVKFFTGESTARQRSDKLQYFIRKYEVYSLILHLVTSTATHDPPCVQERLAL